MLVFEGAAEVRLVDGGRRCAGRVEVKHRGEWGTMCGDYWSMNDAAVVCKQLDCGSAVGAPQDMSIQQCTLAMAEDLFPGRRQSRGLAQRPTAGFVRLVEGKSRCSGRVEVHDGDLWKTVCDSHFGPKAAEYTGFRLVNGSSACAGSVEVQVLGTWGTLCASRWDFSDAHVLCRQLNCGFAESIPGGGHFGRGIGPLVGGGSRCDGRVEIFQRGTWGRVLDDQWDVQEANVVCRQLQCGQAETAYNPPKSERGTGPQPGFLPTAGSQQVRLVNGAGRCAGRVDIYYQGSWGTVCDDGWDLSGAAVVCHQLGLGEFMALRLEDSEGCSGRLPGFCNVGEHLLQLDDSRYGVTGMVSGPAWLDNVQCGEKTNSFWQCPSTPWDPQSCEELRDEIHITCNGLCLLSQCHGRSLLSPDREKIRAMGGEDGCSGRVEVWHRGSWGTVCDDSWDMRDAEVACRQLGCGPAVSALNEAAFGMGQGPIWLEQVECQGMELSLQDCWARPGDGDPTRGRLTSSGRVSVPVIICIILGALLCLLPGLLAGQSSRRAQELFPEAVYEEIGYSPAWEKQEKFGRSDSCSEESPTQLQPYPGNTEEEDGLRSAPDVLVLPRGDPADGYDDAREVSDPGDDAAPGQGAWEMPRAPEEGAGPKDAL
ncbi:PREDICTED: scavenger receptor cysteine-rich type 1 protein M130 {ECO:0000250/UniProtKB:Q86VB7}-like, partial [Fulmarus glacialis]|uniref:scavenger receptor cysteine-rich type 1 protein M130-like n=1 Tax=Fulmarus glacialis TaxID=30455 RepID=UPI00051C9FD1